MRKLVSLTVLALFCAAATASGQLREFTVVAQGAAKSSDKAEDIANAGVLKKYDTIIRQELKSCDAPLQAEPYLPQTGNQNIDRGHNKKKDSAIVRMTLTFTAKDHTDLVRAALDSLDALRREKILECISTKKLDINEKSP